MAIPTGVCLRLTFQRKLLPLLVNSEGTCREGQTSPVPRRALRWGVRKTVHCTLARGTAQMCDRLNSIIAFGLISFLRLAVSSETQRLPTILLGNPREPSTTRSFPQKILESASALQPWSSGPPPSSAPGRPAKPRRKETAVRVIRKTCQKVLRK